MFVILSGILSYLSFAYNNYFVLLGVLINVLSSFLIYFVGISWKETFEQYNIEKNVHKVNTDKAIRNVTEGLTDETYNLYIRIGYSDVTNKELQRRLKRIIDGKPFDWHVAIIGKNRTASLDNYISEFGIVSNDREYNKNFELRKVDDIDISDFKLKKDSIISELLSEYDYPREVIIKHLEKEFDNNLNWGNINLSGKYEARKIVFEKIKELIYLFDIPKKKFGTDVKYLGNEFNKIIDEKIVKEIIDFDKYKNKIKNLEKEIIDILTKIGKMGYSKDKAENVTKHIIEELKKELEKDLDINLNILPKTTQLNGILTNSKYRSKIRNLFRRYNIEFDDFNQIILRLTLDKANNRNEDDEIIELKYMPLTGFYNKFIDTNKVNFRGCCITLGDNSYEIYGETLDRFVLDLMRILIDEMKLFEINYNSNEITNKESFYADENGIVDIEKSIIFMNALLNYEKK